MNENNFIEYVEKLLIILILNFLIYKYVKNLFNIIVIMSLY